MMPRRDFDFLFLPAIFGFFTKDIFGEEGSHLCDRVQELQDRIFGNYHFA
jgi:hypothetical protein